MATRRPLVVNPTGGAIQQELPSGDFIYGIPVKLQVYTSNGVAQYINANVNYTVPVFTSNGTAYTILVTLNG